MSLMKFHVVEKFFVCSQILFELHFRDSVRTKYQKIQKIAEIILNATKIGYFAQFGIFDVVIGSRESKINCIFLSFNGRVSEWIHTL